MTVLGVDPGLSGAMASYDRETGALEIADMPTFNVTVGKRKRARVDAPELHEYFEMQKMMGAELLVLEAVGGRPQQSASSGFVFGYTVGLIYMAAITCRIPVEPVNPQTWKKILNVPGKRLKEKEELRVLMGQEERPTSKQVDGRIIQRADELLPDHRDKWRGPKGGYYMDRAEAAMLAYYGGTFALNSTKVINVRDPEWRMVYRSAKLGA